MPYSWKTAFQIFAPKLEEPLPLFKFRRAPSIKQPSRNGMAVYQEVMSMDAPDELFLSSKWRW